ncbi:MAG: ABC transporter substrate-binding protein [Ruminococcaceae bacterium]|jgi:putative ABC transport system substrate-binding protein|nr:ABC transporter substrate-binding protein [Oscillospiraceae bacterium]
MKKLLAAVLTLSLTAAFLAGCGSSGAPASSEAAVSSEAPAASQAQSEALADKVYKIGVVQLVEHDALDAAYQGFVDGLKLAGYEDGKNIAIDYQNAQGEQANCNTIASKLVNDKDDLILAIATPAAQAVANATTEIPILVTAVTDPADAKLVASNDAPGGNVTGTSDLNPIKEQMELLQQLVPDVKKVGMLYCSSEANSEFQVNLAKEQLKTMGIESVDFTVSSSNEIQQVVESMVGKVDAVYTPTDNMIASGMATVSMIANNAKLPVIVAEPGMVKNGGLGTYGLNYYNLGKQTANMAVKVMVDGTNPGDMPIEYLEQTDLVLNQDTIDALGITVPQELLDQAEIVRTEKAA